MSEESKKAAWEDSCEAWLEANCPDIDPRDMCAMTESLAEFVEMRIAARVEEARKGIVEEIRKAATWFDDQSTGVPDEEWAKANLLRSLADAIERRADLPKAEPAEPARLDADKTAKPLTEIVAHAPAGKRIVGAYGVTDYAYREKAEEKCGRCGGREVITVRGGLEGDDVIDCPDCGGTGKQVK